MYCVGLTGRVGSGKSTVARLFHSLYEIPIISADQLNHALIKPSGEGYEAIKSHFGSSILLPDQHINKSLLRSKMVQDPAVQTWLEQLLHPLIRAAIEHEIKKITHHPYCIIEIPLLIDKALYPYLNRVLLVDSEESMQLKRIMQRDQISAASAQALIHIQASREAYLDSADDVILNGGDMEQMAEQIKSLHQGYLQLAKQ
jgi:dephospho-CoA kinase